MCGPSVPIGRVPVRPSLQTGASARARAPVHARVAPEESNCLYGKSDEFLSSGRLRRAAVTRGESLTLSVRDFSRASPLPSLPLPPAPPPPPAPPARQRGGAGPLLAAAAALDGSNGHVRGRSLGRRERTELKLDY